MVEPAYDKNPCYKNDLALDKNEIDKVNGQIGQYEYWKGMNYEGFKADYLKNDPLLMGLITSFNNTYGMSVDRAFARYKEITGYDYGARANNAGYTQYSEMGQLKNNKMSDDPNCKQISNNITTMKEEIAGMAKTIFAQASAIQAKYGNAQKGYETFRQEYLENSTILTGAMDDFLKETGFGAFELVNSRWKELTGYCLEENASSPGYTDISKWGVLEAQRISNNKIIGELKNVSGNLTDKANKYATQDIIDKRKAVKDSTETWDKYKTDAGFELFIDQFVADNSEIIKINNDISRLTKECDKMLLNLNSALQALVNDNNNELTQLKAQESAGWDTFRRNYQSRMVNNVKSEYQEKYGQSYDNDYLFYTGKVTNYNQLVDEINQKVNEHNDILDLTRKETGLIDIAKKEYDDAAKYYNDLIGMTYETWAGNFIAVDPGILAKNTEFIEKKTAYDSLNLTDFKADYLEKNPSADVDPFKIVATFEKDTLNPQTAGLVTWLMNECLNGRISREKINILYTSAVNQGWINPKQKLSDLSDENAYALLDGKIPSLSDKAAAVHNEICQAFTDTNIQTAVNYADNIVNLQRSIEYYETSSRVVNYINNTDDAELDDHIKKDQTRLDSMQTDYDKIVESISNDGLSASLLNDTRNINLKLGYTYTRGSGANATQPIDEISWSLTAAGASPESNVIFAGLLGYPLFQSDMQYNDGNKLIDGDATLEMGVSHPFIKVDLFMPFDLLNANDQARVDKSTSQITGWTDSPDNVNFTSYSTQGGIGNISYGIKNTTSYLSASVGYNGVNNYTYIKGGMLDSFKSIATDAWGKPLEFEFNYKDGGYRPSSGNGGIYFDSNGIGYAQKEANYWYGSEMITQTGYFDPSKLSYNQVDIYSPTVLFLSRAGESIKWVADALYVTLHNNPITILTGGQLEKFSSIDTVYKRDHGAYGIYLKAAEFAIDCLLIYVSGFASTALSGIGATARTAVSQASLFTKYLVNTVTLLPYSVYNLSVGMSLYMHTGGTLISAGLNGAGLNQDYVDRMRPGVGKDMLNMVHQMGSGSVFSSLLQHIGTPEGLAFIGIFAALGPIMRIGSEYIGNKLSGLKNAVKTPFSNVFKFIHNIDVRFTAQGVVNLGTGSGIASLLSGPTAGLGVVAGWASRGAAVLAKAGIKYSFIGLEWAYKGLGKLGSFITGSAANTFKSETLAAISRGLGGVFEEAVKEPLLANIFLGWLPNNVQEFAVEFFDILDGSPSHNITAANMIDTLTQTNRLLEMNAGFAGMNSTERDSVLDTVKSKYGKPMDFAKSLSAALKVNGAVFENWQETFKGAASTEKIQLLALLAETNGVLGRFREIGLSAPKFNKSAFGQIYGNGRFLQYAQDMNMVKTQAKVSMEMLNSAGSTFSAESIDAAQLTFLNNFGVTSRSLETLVKNSLFTNTGLKTALAGMISGLRDVEARGAAIEKTAQLTATKIDELIEGVGNGISDEKVYAQSINTLIFALSTDGIMNEAQSLKARSLLGMEFTKLINGRLSIDSLALATGLYKAINDTSTAGEFFKYLEFAATDARETGTAANGFNLDIITLLSKAVSELSGPAGQGSIDNLHEGLIDYMGKAIDTIDPVTADSQESLRMLRGLQSVINADLDEGLVNKAIGKITLIANNIATGIKIDNPRAISVLSEGLNILNGIEFNPGIKLDRTQQNDIQDVKTQVAGQFSLVITSINNEDIGKLGSNDILAVMRGIDLINNTMPDAKSGIFDNSVFSKTVLLCERLSTLANAGNNNEISGLIGLLEASRLGISLLSAVPPSNAAQSQRSDAVNKISETCANLAKGINNALIEDTHKQALLTGMLESAVLLSRNMSKDISGQFMLGIANEFAKVFSLNNEISSVTGAVDNIVSLFGMDNFIADTTAVSAALILLNRMIEYDDSVILHAKGKLPDIIDAVSGIFRSSYEGKLNTLDTASKYLFRDIIFNLDTITAKVNLGANEDRKLDEARTLLALSLLDDIRSSTQMDKALADNMASVIRLSPKSTQKAVWAFMNNGAAAPSAVKLGWLIEQIRASNPAYQILSSEIKSALNGGKQLDIVTAVLENGYEDLTVMVNNALIAQELGPDKMNALNTLLRASPWRVSREDKQIIAKKKEEFAAWLKGNLTGLKDIQAYIAKLADEGSLNPEDMEKVKTQIEDFKTKKDFSKEADEIAKVFGELTQLLNDNKVDNQRAGINRLTEDLQRLEEELNVLNTLIKNAGTDEEVNRLKTGLLELTEKINNLKGSKDRIEQLQLESKIPVISAGKGSVISVDSMGRVINTRDALAYSLAVAEYLSIQRPDGWKWWLQQNFIYGLHEGKFSVLAMGGGKSIA
ncbi:MAG: hypothetical protein WC300_04745, partial [Candidatus Omnitrophota bacterium]